jgi:hypothetical protein
LLSVSAFKPMIDKILTEAGFAAGPDALTSLTNALAQKRRMRRRSKQRPHLPRLPQRRPQPSPVRARRRSVPRLNKT